MFAIPSNYLLNCLSYKAEDITGLRYMPQNQISAPRIFATTTRFLPYIYRINGAGEVLFMNKIRLRLTLKSINFKIKRNGAQNQDHFKPSAGILPVSCDTYVLFTCCCFC